MDGHEVVCILPALAPGEAVHCGLAHPGEAGEAVTDDLLPLLLGPQLPLQQRRLLLVHAVLEHGGGGLGLRLGALGGDPHHQQAHRQGEVVRVHGFLAPSRSSRSHNLRPSVRSFVPNLSRALILHLLASDSS